MKTKYILLCIWLFWVAALVGCVWLFKALLAAPSPPEFGAGVVGGALWAFGTAKVLEAVRGSYADYVNELRARAGRES